MFLRTSNSSFIFDRRRLSIRLWAVLRATFFPELVAPLCPFFLPLSVVAAATAALA